MARYWEDWSSSVLGADPVGWTRRWDSADAPGNVTYDVTTTADPLAPAGRMVTIDQAASARDFLSWDLLDGDPLTDRIDIRILVKIPTINASGNAISIQCRGSGTGAAETGIGVNIYKTSGGVLSMRGTQYNAGASTSSDIVTLTGYSEGDVVWLRLNASGTTSRYGIAHAATPWDETLREARTGVAVTSTGWAGIFSFSAPSSPEIYAVGVGTGEDYAPVTDPDDDETYQYFEDFSSSPLGADPVGWTRRWVTTGITYDVEAETDPLAPAGKRVRVAPTANARKGITIDELDNKLGRQDVEIRILMRAASAVGSGNNVISALVRGSGAAGSEDMYHMNLHDDTISLRKGEYVGGASAYDTTVDISSYISWGEAFWFRVSIRANNLRYGIALASDPHNEVYASGKIDSTIDTAGWAGLLNYTLGVDTDIYAVGIGWNSVPAPIAPPISGTVPVEFTGSVPDQTVGLDLPATINLFPYYTGSETPFTYTSVGAALPSGMSINSSSGVLEGTPDTAGVYAGIVIRATDATPDTADSNSFTVTVDVAALAVPNDFDSAIGTVIVSDAATPSPSITVVPDPQGQVSGWLETYVRVTKVVGKTPVFTLNFTDFRSGSDYPQDPAWGMIWRYVDDTDPGTGRSRSWNFFDNNNTSVTAHEFSNNAAFTGDDIEVAVIARVTYHDIEAAFAYMDSHPSGFAYELPSSLAAPGLPKNVHAQHTNPGSNKPNTAPTVPLNLRGIGLEDTSVQPDGGKDKLTFAVIGGIHSSEDQGQESAHSMAYLFLEGTSPEAIWLRKNTRLAVYSAQPAGRYYGAERWTVEGTSEDANRSWKNGASSQINNLIAAQDLDAPYWDVMIDYHGASGLNGNGSQPEEFSMYTNTGYTAKTQFFNRMVTQTGNNFAAFGFIAVGSSEDYFDTVENSQLSVTLEHTYAPTGFPDQDAMFDELAIDTAAVLQQMLVAGELVQSGGYDAAVTGAVQAEPASTSGQAVVFGVSVATGAVQAEPALGSGSVDIAGIVSVSGNVQAGPASTFGSIDVQGIVSITGSVQADPASTSGLVTSSSLVIATGAVEAAAAITSGFINSGFTVAEIKYKNSAGLWVPLLSAHVLDFHTDVTITSPVNGELLTYVNGEWVNLPGSGGGGGGGGATESEITQVAHGFAVLDCVRFNGISWVKAQADDPSTTALGMVVAVADADNFTFAMSGRYQLTNGLLDNEWYYLSAATAGDLVAAEPTISQPIAYSESNDWIVIYPYRPTLSAPDTGPQVGEIKAYIGIQADLKFGWYICDGSNGTPDLRGRSIFGADGNGIVLDTDAGAMPAAGVTGDDGAHGHSASSLTAGSHSHTTYTATGGAHTHGNVAGAASGSGASVYWPSASGSHSHPASTSSTHAGHQHDVDVDNAGDHNHTTPAGELPPLRGAHWIMYTGV